MTIRKRILVCECGHQYEEDNDHKIEGEVLTSCWSIVNNEVKENESGSAAVLLKFKRDVCCIKCKSPLLKEFNHILVDLEKSEFFEKCLSREVIW